MAHGFTLVLRAGGRVLWKQASISGAQGIRPSNSMACVSTCQLATPTGRIPSTNSSNQLPKANPTLVQYSHHRRGPWSSLKGLSSKGYRVQRTEQPCAAQGRVTESWKRQRGKCSLPESSRHNSRGTMCLQLCPTAGCPSSSW